MAFQFHTYNLHYTGAKYDCLLVCRAVEKSNTRWVFKVIKTRVDGRYRSVDATSHKGRIFYKSHTRKFCVKTI